MLREPKRWKLRLDFKIHKLKQQSCAWYTYLTTGLGWKGHGQPWGARESLLQRPPLAAGRVLFKSISIRVLLSSHVHGVHSLVNEVLNPKFETQIQFFPHCFSWAHRRYLRRGDFFIIRGRWGQSEKFYNGKRVGFGNGHTGEWILAPWTSWAMWTGARPPVWAVFSFGLGNKDMTVMR